MICRVLLSRSRINIALNTTSSYRKKENLISVFNISHHNLLLKYYERYNHCISTLLGCIHNRSLYFSAYISVAVMLVGGFFQCKSTSDYDILSRALVHSSTNKWSLEITQPPTSRSPMYILLIISHVNFWQNSTSLGIPSQRNPQ